MTTSAEPVAEPASGPHAGKARTHGRVVSFAEAFRFWVAGTVGPS